MATLSDFNGQASFTIGGNSFNNRASSGTPIYERTGGDGVSGGAGIGVTGNISLLSFDSFGAIQSTMTGLRFVDRQSQTQSGTSYTVDPSKTYRCVGINGVRWNNDSSSSPWIHYGGLLCDSRPIPVVTDLTSNAMGSSRQISNASYPNSPDVNMYMYIYSNELYMFSTSPSSTTPAGYSKKHDAKVLIMEEGAISSGGSGGGILDMEVIEFQSHTIVEYDTTTGRFLEIDFHKGGGGQNGRAFIDLSDLTVVRADDDGTSNSILQPGQSIDGSYRVISDNGGSSAFNLSVRTVATGKLQFYQSSGTPRFALFIRHA